MIAELKFRKKSQWSNKCMQHHNGVTNGSLLGVLDINFRNQPKYKNKAKSQTHQPYKEKNQSLFLIRTKS